MSPPSGRAPPPPEPPPQRLPRAAFPTGLLVVDFLSKATTRVGECWREELPIKTNFHLETSFRLGIRGPSTTMANIPSPAGQSAAAAQTSNGQTYRGPFAIMTVLFFMWGFMTVWNDILIPRFKEAFTLSFFQAMLVQFAFFGAYGIGSLIYFAISVRSGDPINRIGYKNGVIIGLLIAALGSALFFPGA